MKKLTRMNQAKVLSQELGIELPLVEAPEGVAGRSQSIKLITFAIEHNFVITPVGYGYYVDSFAQFLACPCDSTRKSCPCEQAVDEVRDKGHCKCQLFWRDLKTYLAKI